MIDANILLQWINRACNLHPNNKEFDAVKFGEFDYVARCAYKYGNDQVLHIDVEKEMERMYKNGIEAGKMLEREKIIKYAKSVEFNRQYGDFAPKAYELIKWIESQ
jgi:hypothetical protein